MGCLEKSVCKSLHIADSRLRQQYYLGRYKSGENIVAGVMAGKYSARRQRGPLIKTQLDLNAQTAHHTTGHTILADAQHKAKHVSYVKKRTTLQAHPLAKGGIP